MGVVIYATRLQQPGEFALWCGGALVFSGLLGSRLAPTAFDVVVLHVDDAAMIGRRLGAGDHAPDIVLSAIAGWWEHELAFRSPPPTPPTVDASEMELPGQ